MAYTCFNDEPLSTSLLGNEKEPNAFNSISNRLDGTCEPNLRSVAGCAGKLDQRYGRPLPARFPHQQPQKQDEAHAAYTHPCKNELSCSAVTQGKKLLRHPVVEQLAMIETRLAITEQDHRKSTNDLRWHDPRAVSEELPRQTQ